MKHRYWIRAKAGRLLTIFIALAFYIVLAIIDAKQTFSGNTTSASFSLPVWVAFGFSLSVALIFFVVGSLAWFYAHDRKVAFLLLCFSYISVLPFELETASIEPTSSIVSQLSSTISSVASSFALLLFAVLSLIFPRNYLTPLLPKALSKKQLFAHWLRSRVFFIYCYILILFLCICLSLLYNVGVYFSYSLLTQGWVNSGTFIYYIVVIVGILTTIIISFRQSTVRERQQLRFFAVGVVLAFAPLLLLTVIPQLFGIFSIGGEITTLTLILLPLSLGYSILRYQFLIFDTYIRRTTNWIVGVIFLAMIVYLIAVLSNQVLGGSIPFRVVFVTIVTAVLAPLAWWSGKMLTERILFKESLYYRRLIDRPVKMGNEVLDLEKAGQLITVAAVQAFKTPQVCLFVLAEEDGCYYLYPRLTEDQSDDPRRNLVKRLASTLAPESTLGVDVLMLEKAVAKRLDQARRPLLSYEITRSEEEMPRGLDRYIASTSPTDESNVLVAPVRVQGKMIAMLALGERSDSQSYAGPDFEIAELILARFASTLETARLQERSRQHAALLNNLYRASTKVTVEFQEFKEVASSYAQKAADAMNTGIAIWMYNKKRNSLHRVTFAGSGPRITSAETLQPTAQDWSPHFYTGDNPYKGKELPTQVPPCLPQVPNFSFAWLPLDKGDEYIGVLVITYSRPHLFLKEEMHVLEMFANQCTTTLENARITMRLRAAYERQKELDVLKDEFITTASHELRTPLTAVLGYIELLQVYGQSLPVESLTEFIAKAHRGCDELVLMVNNMMDASQIQIDVNNTKITNVSMREAVMHIVEIVEGMEEKEPRAIAVSISPTLYVMADPIRLRQVLLNMVNNALKYSPIDTPIEITANADERRVTVYVRDYGLGVPLADQSRLFERFVRLERDMNSPKRGAGLGLYICKQLVEAMGGNIRVESRGIAGEGSIFIFTLQRVEPDQPLSTQGPQSVFLLQP